MAHVHYIHFTLYTILVVKVQNQRISHKTTVTIKIQQSINNVLYKIAVIILKPLCK